MPQKIRIDFRLMKTFLTSVFLAENNIGRQTLII